MRDDGCGIDPAAPHGGSAFRGMQERVQGLGRQLCRRQRARPWHRDTASDHPARTMGAAVSMTKSVLIIDDHPIVLQACRRMLGDAGIEFVFEASDLLGLSALRRLSPTS